jgi:Flp pilus assembly pilin Flp
VRHEARGRRVVTHQPGVWSRLVDDQRGQDLVEYALLTAAVGLVAIATWPAVATSIGTAYRALDANTQGLWEPPPPGGGS